MDRAIWLDEELCRQVSVGGGKAASLALLASNFRVPPGFVLPEEVTTRSAVVEAYQRLGEMVGEVEPAVAVRSSAGDEDGRTAAFAGQYETFLNVRGVDAVWEAVERCRGSARSEQVSAYRRAQGQTGAPVMSVLVQQLILADASVVAFSADPVSGRRSEVVINAAWGLGEALVGGRVTPDSYYVDKADFSIREERLADKERMSVPGDSGIREVAVPRFLRRRPCLTSLQVVTTARLAAELEEQMGWPVDIEGAFSAEQLWLLQCRPVSTL